MQGCHSRWFGEGDRAKVGGGMVRPVCGPLLLKEG